MEFEIPENFEHVEEPELNLEEDSAKVTLEDCYKMLYILVRQSEAIKPGSRMSFDLRVFKTLPKKVALHFLNKDGHLFVYTPEKPSDRKKKNKSKLYLPHKKKIITQTLN